MSINPLGKKWGAPAPAALPVPRAYNGECSLPLTPWAESGSAVDFLSSRFLVKNCASRCEYKWKKITALFGFTKVYIKLEKSGYFQGTFEDPDMLGQ